MMYDTLSPFVQTLWRNYSRRALTMLGALTLFCLTFVLPLLYVATPATLKSQSIPMAFWNQDLVNSAHNQMQCMALGNTLVNLSGAMVCKDAGTACTSGWTAYSSYTITAAKTCTSAGTCTTGEHTTFATTAPETCSYCTSTSAKTGACLSYGTCTATVTYKACY